MGESEDVGGSLIGVGGRGDAIMGVDGRGDAVVGMLGTTTGLSVFGIM